VITIVAFGDHDVDRPLAASSVVPGHLLCTTNVIVIQFERVGRLHLLEGILLVGSDFVDHHSSRLWLFWANLVVADSHQLHYCPLGNPR